MKTFRLSQLAVFFTITLLLLQLVSVAYAKRPEWPPLRTDEQKVAFLLYVREHIPSIFEESAVFGRDWFELLDKQNEVMKLLEENPKYKELLLHHPDPVALQLGQIITQDGSFALTPQAAQALRPELTSTLRALPDENVADALLSRISKNIAILTQVNPASMIVGLVKLVPKEKQGEIYKTQVPKEKIAKISAMLPENIVTGPQKFIYSAYGIQPPPGLNETELNTYVRAEAIKVVESAIHSQEVLQKDIELYTLLSDAEGKLTGDRMHLEQKLEHLEQLPLDYVRNKESLRARLATVLERLDSNDPVLASDKSKKEGTFLLENMMNARIRGSVAAQATESVKPAWKLLEVPPQLGLFRGCVGADCSTKTTFSYPNSPNERVFFVIDEKGKVRGYLSGTTVEYAGKKSFYLNALNGSTISGENTKKIIQGLHRSKAELGYEHILLPEDSNLPVKFNSPVIRDVFAEAISGKGNVKIDFMDADLRAGVFDHPRFSQKDDDKVKDNSEAVIYQPTNEELLKQDVKVVQNPIETAMTRAIERRDAMLFGLDVAFSGKIKQGSRIAATANIPLKDYSRLVELMKNSKKRKVDDFLREMTAALEQEHIHVDEAFIKDQFFLFQEGFLQAPDLLTSPRMAEAKDFVRMVSYKGEKPSAIISKRLNAFVENNLEAFFAKNPTPAEIANLRAGMTSVLQTDIDMKIVKRGMSMNGLDYFLQASQIGMDPEDASPYYIDQIQKTILEGELRFFSQNPTPKQVAELSKRITNDKKAEAFLKAAFLRMKSSKEFLALTTELSSSQDPKALTRVGRVSALVMDQFLALNPSPGELVHFRTGIVNVPGSKLKKAKGCLLQTLDSLILGRATSADRS